MRGRCVLFTLLLFVSGCAGNTPEATELERIWSIAPGQFAELNLVLADGHELRATYNATGAMSWDVHGHREGAVRTFAQGVDANATITFTPPSAGPYSLLFVNPSDQAWHNVTALVLFHGELVSEHP